MSKICSQLEKNRLKIVELLNKNIDLKYQLHLEIAESITETETLFLKGIDSEPVAKKVKYARIPSLRKTIPIEVDGVKCDENHKPIKYFTINDIK